MLALLNHSMRSPKCNVATFPKAPSIRPHDDVSPIHIGLTGNIRKSGGSVEEQNIAIGGGRIGLPVNHHRVPGSTYKGKPPQEDIHNRLCLQQCSQSSASPIHCYSKPMQIETLLRIVWEVRRPLECDTESSYPLLCVQRNTTHRPFPMKYPGVVSLGEQVSNLPMLVWNGIVKVDNLLTAFRRHTSRKGQYFVLCAVDI